MNNEKYNHIIDEAYDNYSKEYEKDNSVGFTMLVQRVDGKSMHRKPNIEMFVTMCTYDSHFSERWGLKIEERKLNYDERFRIAYKNLDLRKKLESKSKMLHFPDGHNKVMDDANIPTKLIIVTYKDEKIEVYE
jgi:hypothetical protein